MAFRFRKYIKKLEVVDLKAKIEADTESKKFTEDELKEREAVFFLLFRALQKELSLWG